MARLKSMRIAVINWCVRFEEVRGSYYDYAASVYSNNYESHQSIVQELLNKGWRSIDTSNNDLLIFEKDRHIIRLYKLWVGEGND